MNVKDTDILARTDSGLDIILYYYPQARECVGTNKKFKIRESETDASACIKMYNGVYKVTDFGQETRAKSPFDICMEEENTDFIGAINILAARYGIVSGSAASMYKPIIETRPATSEEGPGFYEFVYRDHFRPEEIKLFAPHGKEEHMAALHWHSLESFSFVTKKREILTKKSTDTYPIFVRECYYENKEGKEDKFYKIYEPKADKQYRFQSRGEKPHRYVNGLFELAKAYRDYNSREETKFRNDPTNADAQYKEKKMAHAIIASGERDAACIKAFGSNPIWFNSETESVDPSVMKQIGKYVEDIYLIPDIDATGIKKGKEKACAFKDLKVIWLPKELKQHKDHRGNPCKDFRDYCEYHHRQTDFNKLFNIAVTTRFWNEYYNDKKGKMMYEIDSINLHNFLWCHGYCALHDDNSDAVQLIHIDGNVVERLKPKDVLAFIRAWATRQMLPNEVRNLILNSPKVNESAISQLGEVELDFTSYTQDSQNLYFDGITWHITADGVEEVRKEDCNSMVWDNNVIKHKVKREAPYFDYKVEEIDGEIYMDIKVKPHNSNFFNYLINSSRTYWRKELEEAWAEKSIEEMEQYKETHKFDIAGPLLSPGEIAEQKNNLLNKIYAIGYNLHRYKSPSRAWAIYAMDNKIGDDGECNGRSGKSFLFKSFAHFMTTVSLSGRNPRLMENAHVYDQINQHTDFVLIDDCDRRLDLGLFYDSITSGITVNPKNNKSFFIPFEESPKFGFTTNYVPRDFDASTNARLLYLVFSDYYHEMTEDSDYRESRSIFNDFNRNLFTADYPEEMWNADFNFFAQCLSFYLDVVKKNIKIQPPMANIVMRKLKVDMTQDFEDWASAFFAEDGDNVNTLLVREDAYESFINEAKVNKAYWKMQKFTKALRAFCLYTPYIEELDPAELKNGSGRIIKKIDDKSKEMIYVKTQGVDITGMTKEEKELGDVPF